MIHLLVSKKFYVCLHRIKVPLPHFQLLLWWASKVNWLGKGKLVSLSKKAWSFCSFSNLVWSLSQQYIVRCTLTSRQTKYIFFKIWCGNHFKLVCLRRLCINKVNAEKNVLATPLCLLLKIDISSKVHSDQNLYFWQIKFARNDEPLAW